MYGRRVRVIFRIYYCKTVVETIPAIQRCVEGSHLRNRDASLSPGAIAAFVHVMQSVPSFRRIPVQLAIRTLPQDDVGVSAARLIGRATGA